MPCNVPAMVKDSVVNPPPERGGGAPRALRGATTVGVALVRLRQSESEHVRQRKCTGRGVACLSARDFMSYASVEDRDDAFIQPDIPETWRT